MCHNEFICVDLDPFLWFHVEKAFSIKKGKMVRQIKACIGHRLRVNQCKGAQSTRLCKYCCLQGLSKNIVNAC